MKLDKAVSFVIPEPKQKMNKKDSKRKALQRKQRLLILNEREAMEAVRFCDSLNDAMAILLLSSKNKSEADHV